MRSTLGVWCCVALGAIVVVAALLAPTRGLAQGGPPAGGGLAAGAGAPPAGQPGLGAAPALAATPPGAPPATAVAPGPSVTERVPMIGRPLDPTLTGRVRNVVPLARPRPLPVVVPSVGMYDNRPPLHWPSERAEERENEARFRAACWRS